MFGEIFNNNWILLILSSIILWFFWRLTIENSTIENYGNGAMGPYAISTGNQAFATRPTARSVNFRYLDDYRNW